MLSWIAWNRTVLTFKLRIKLNWVVWNRSVYMYKNGFGINNQQWLMCHKTKARQINWFSFCLWLYYIIDQSLYINKIIYIYIYIYSYLCVFTKPSTLTGCDKKPIFKHNLTSVNSVFSFSQTGCYTNLKQLSLFYIFSIAGGIIIGFMLFPRALTLCYLRPGLELRSPCSFPPWIIITSRLLLTLSLSFSLSLSIYIYTLPYRGWALWRRNLRLPLA